MKFSQIVNCCWFANVQVSSDGHGKWLCCIAVLNTMSTQGIGKVMKYLVEPVYSDLALGYCISGPEPTINTESCPANSFVWMILITSEGPRVGFDFF